MVHKVESLRYRWIDYRYISFGLGKHI